MWLGLITVVPGLLLLSEHLLLADSIIFLKKNYGLLLAIPLFSLLIILPTSLLILALSSLTTNSRYAAVGFAALLVGTPVLSEVLSFVTRKEAFHLLSIWANYDLLGSYLFDLSPPYSYPWYLALLICLGIMVSSLWVLQKRIRAVQIVQQLSAALQQLFLDALPVSFVECNLLGHGPLSSDNTCAGISRLFQ